MMAAHSIVPKVGFVINLVQTDSHELHLARLRHLVHLFRGHRVPATWAVDDVKLAQLLREPSVAGAAEDLALCMDASWGGPQIPASRFTDELCKRLAAVAEFSEGPPALVVGDQNLLRSRTALLSAQGIRAVISSSLEPSTSLKPRPLPCSLWQLLPNVRLPKRRRSRWLPSRHPSVREVIAAASEGIALVSVESAELNRISARRLQTIEKLLREVSWSASRGQMQISSITEIVDELVCRHQVKPQRSILRLAA